MPAQGFWALVGPRWCKEQAPEGCCRVNVRPRKIRGSYTLPLWRGARKREWNSGYFMRIAILPTQEDDHPECLLNRS